MAAHIDVIGVIDHVDSRNRIDLFQGLIVKTNEVEVLFSI